MREGTIIYLADAKNIAADADLDGALAKCGLDPRWTELAASAEGFYTPEMAALSLVRRGALRVSIASAIYGEGGDLALGEARVRVAG